MVHAPLRYGLSFDPFTFQDDSVTTAEVNVGGREIAEALMVSR